MDLIRRARTSSIRTREGADAVPIRWFFTDWDTPVYEAPTPFRNRDWGRRQSWSGIGEQEPELCCGRRDTRWRNGSTGNVYIAPFAPCPSAEAMRRAAVPPEPEFLTDPQGVAYCCNVDVTIPAVLPIGVRQLVLDVAPPLPAPDERVGVRLERDRLLAPGPIGVRLEELSETLPDVAELRVGVRLELPPEPDDLRVGVRLDTPEPPGPPCWCGMVEPETTLTLPACVRVTTTTPWLWGFAELKSIAWSGVADITGLLILHAPGEPETPMHITDPVDPERVWSVSAAITCVGDDAGVYGPTTITVQLSDVTNPEHDRLYSGEASGVKIECSPSCFRFRYVLTGADPTFDQAVIELVIGDCAEPCGFDSPCCPDVEVPEDIVWRGSLPDAGCGAFVGDFAAVWVSTCVWVWFSDDEDWMVVVSRRGGAVFVALYDLTGANPHQIAAWSKAPFNCTEGQVLDLQVSEPPCSYPPSLTIAPSV